MFPIARPACLQHDRRKRLSQPWSLQNSDPANARSISNSDGRRANGAAGRVYALPYDPILSAKACNCPAYSRTYIAILYAIAWNGVRGYDMDMARSPQQLGAILRRYRKKGSLTQTDVAARTQLRQATISALENGEAGTRLSTLNWLCNHAANRDLPRLRIPSDGANGFRYAPS